MAIKKIERIENNLSILDRYTNESELISSTKSELYDLLTIINRA